MSDPAPERCLLSVCFPLLGPLGKMSRRELAPLTTWCFNWFKGTFLLSFVAPDTPMVFTVAALDRLARKLGQKALVRLSSQATGKAGLRAGLRRQPASRGRGRRGGRAV